MRRRLLGIIFSCGFALPALVVPAVPAASADAPRARGAVQVTSNTDPVRAHSSPQIGVNPTNGELVILESNPRGSRDQRQCRVHLSSDDGRTWSHGGDPMLPPYTDCSLHGDYGPYVTLGFAQDGTLYLAFVANDPRFAVPSAFSSGTVVRGGVFAHPPRRTPRNVFLARSDDGGRTFETTAVFIGADAPARAPAKLPPEGENKGPMLAVDPTDPSRVYVGWRQGDLTDSTRKLRTMVAASSDGGRTFSEPVDISDERGGDYPALAVDADRVVHAVYWTRSFSPTPRPDDEPPPIRPIQYVRSTDGGRTWSEPVVIDPGNQDAERPPLLVADPGSGRLFVSWYGHEEARNAADDFEGDLDIFVRASGDGGRTWSERRVVNDDGPGTDQFEPGIAVAPDGRVDVAWYDFRNSTTTRDEAGFADVYYASSTDGGQTFTPNVRVTDRAIDRSIGVWSNNVDSRFNVGVASVEDAVYVAWQDSRNGDAETNSEDVYMTSIPLGAVERSGLGLPDGALIAAGVPLGMGIAMLLAFALARRGRGGTHAR